MGGFAPVVTTTVRAHLDTAGLDHVRAIDSRNRRIPCGS
jgi:hypothetical protein